MEENSKSQTAAGDQPEHAGKTGSHDATFEGNGKCFFVYFLSRDLLQSFSVELKCC